MSDAALQNAQDADHLRLLGVFHYVCAGIIALISCFPVIYLLLGIAMLLRPRSFGPPNDSPPALFGLIFVIFGGGAVVFGWTFAGLVAWAGRCLHRRAHYMYCLVMAGVTCLFMPLGTVLGVFTIMVLMRPSVKALFTSPLRSA